MENKELFDNMLDMLATLCKEKGYGKEIPGILAIICGSYQMHDNFGTTIDAMKRVCEEIRRGMTEPEILSFAIELSGA